MSTILDTIISTKKQEIAKLKPFSSIQRFEQKGFFWQISNRSLVQRLNSSDNTGIIAEFKRKSPSKGWFKSKELEVEKVLRSYNDNGAAAASVLTDEEYFGGDLDDLIQAKIISDIPILRKDFIIDPWQIAEAKAFGADIILLIAACLTTEEVKQLGGYAKSIGLEVLLEIHNEEELNYICDEVDLVGVNNRNLKTFDVDVKVSFDLIKHIPSSKPAIAESGISDTKTIVTLKEAGFKGFLIGETFMKEPDPAKAFLNFVEELKTQA